MGADEERQIIQMTLASAETADRGMMQKAMEIGVDIIPGHAAFFQGKLPLGREAVEHFLHALPKHLADQLIREVRKMVEEK